MELSQIFFASGIISQEKIKILLDRSGNMAHCQVVGQNEWNTMTKIIEFFNHCFLVRNPYSLTHGFMNESGGVTSVLEKKITHFLSVHVKSVIIIANMLQSQKLGIWNEILV